MKPLADDQLLENLFEDFEEKKEEKKEKNNGGKKWWKKWWKNIFFKFLYLLILLIIIGAIYYFFIMKKTENNTITSPIISTPITSTPLTVKEEIKEEIKVEIKEMTALGSIDAEYNNFSPLFVDVSWKWNTASRFSNTWGENNLKVSGDNTIIVSYPKWSYKPSWNVVGGAWFLYDIGQSTDSAQLDFNIELDPKFNFVKWGKIAGLCGGNCPRGLDGNMEWFSTIFSWKRWGLLDMNIIYPGSKSYGVNLWEAIWVLVPWNKYKLSQRITLNTPGKADGVLVIYVSGQKVFEKRNYVFRNTQEVKINGLIFSSFFWWSDVSWSTPVDTFIKFSNFTLSK